MKTPPLPLTPLDTATAPEGSKALVEKVQKDFRFIPNLFGVFAHSPAFLSGYMALDQAYGQSCLSPKERQVVLLAASVENACRYCTAAHSTILKNAMKAPAEMVEAIRAGRSLSDTRLEALVRLTREMVEKRGHVSAEIVEEFVAAGYGREQVLEVLLGVALKTMSNYTHHLSGVEIDPAFAPEVS
ncbi:MAG: carboxymuconolactone decarboxylase family protein [Proteobacteria bacterium]|nr:carboxymuconolactone decarboxylase family protein [Pseudomonadota bacterium]